MQEEKLQFSPKIKEENVKEIIKIRQIQRGLNIYKEFEYGFGNLLNLKINTPNAKVS